jgi:hypothetical protein
MRTHFRVFSVFNVRVWHACVSAPRGCVGPSIAPAVLIARPAARRRPRARVCGSAHQRGRRAWAAGVTWTSRTLNASWAGRYTHTSVIDAAGAIYVIGGAGVINGTGVCPQDVWVSTDGGARPDNVVGGEVLGCTEGYLGALKGYSGGIMGTYGGISRT